MVGCGGGDSTDDTVSAGTDADSEGDDGEMEFPGDIVECCWMVTYGAALPCNALTCYSYAEEACLPAGLSTPCINHAAADLDGDGTIGTAELQTACGQVCVDQGYDGTQLAPSTGLLPVDGAWDDPGGFVWNCSPVGTINSSVVDEQACTPPMFSGSRSFHGPTHIGVVQRSDSADQVQLIVLGTSLRPVFDGATNLALFDCATGGIDGGTCKLQLEGLSLSLAEPVAIGEHTIPSAELMLAGVAEAEVRFAHCFHGTCIGHFRFSEQGGNPVGLGLGWAERHDPSRSATTQYAPLSNGAAGFGGISMLDGLVSLDPTANTGTLVLQGSGRDMFGDGAFASALFRIEFDLAPLTRP
jgi:hypothetical protein